MLEYGDTDNYHENYQRNSRVSRWKMGRKGEEKVWPTERNREWKDNEKRVKEDREAKLKLICIYWSGEQN